MWERGKCESGAPSRCRRSREQVSEEKEESPKRGKKALPLLPCGCNGSTGQGKMSAMLLPDETRICREHGKRWKLTWVELPAAETKTASG